MLQEQEVEDTSETKIIVSLKFVCKRSVPYKVRQYRQACK